jgi:hypothetical protein
MKMLIKEETPLSHESIYIIEVVYTSITLLYVSIYLIEVTSTSIDKKVTYAVIYIYDEDGIAATFIGTLQLCLKLCLCFAIIYGARSYNRLTNLLVLMKKPLVS